MKVETDIITIITAMMLVIMYVEIFKTDIIVFISNIITAFDITLTYIFQYQSMSLLILKISLSNYTIKGKLYKLPIIKFCVSIFHDI